MTALDYTVEVTMEVNNPVLTKITYLPYPSEFREYARANVDIYEVITIDTPENAFNGIYESLESYLSQNETTKAALLISNFNSSASTSFTVGVRKEFYDELQETLDSKLELGDLPDTFDDLVDGETNKAYTSTEKTKLAGIATAATANDTDANLKNRANHTGTQTASTISDFTEAAQDAIASSLSSEFNYNDAANTIAMRVKSFTSNPSRSIVTGTGATGFQVSSTRDALVNYSITVSTSVQIGIATNVSGYVVLEIAPTNSATAGDWSEIGRTGNGQNIGLAIALSSAQSTLANMTGIVPAGYYAKLRSVNTNGTPTYSYNGGQEVLL